MGCRWSGRFIIVETVQIRRRSSHTAMVISTSSFRNSPKCLRRLSWTTGSCSPRSAWSAIPSSTHGDLSAHPQRSSGERERALRAHFEPAPQQRPTSVQPEPSAAAACRPIKRPPLCHPLSTKNPNPNSIDRVCPLVHISPGIATPVVFCTVYHIFYNH